VRTARGDDMPIAAALDIAITVLENDDAAVVMPPQTQMRGALIWLRKLRSMALASAAKKPDEKETDDGK
jgi:hypothetical protein